MNNVPSCKTCGHEVDWHSAHAGFFNRFVFRIVGIIGCTTGAWCECKVFVPEDNLKFLEWKHGRNVRFPL